MLITYANAKNTKTWESHSHTDNETWHPVYFLYGFWYKAWFDSLSLSLLSSATWHLKLANKSLRNLFWLATGYWSNPKRRMINQYRTLSSPGFRKKSPFKAVTCWKVGPGYPIPAINEVDEPWKDKSNEVKYVPLQPREGDVAIYLQKSGWEIEFNNEKYVIIPTMRF